MALRRSPRTIARSISPSRGDRPISRSSSLARTEPQQPSLSAEVREAVKLVAHIADCASFEEYAASLNKPADAAWLELVTHAKTLRQLLDA